MKRALLAAAMFLLLPAIAFAQPARERSLHIFLQRSFADAPAEWPDTSYVTAFADLDGDGRDEALVTFHSGLFCGSGGCALYIYTPAGASWRALAELTIVNAPVRLLNSSSHGWRDLAVSVRGGGIDRPREARIRFNGHSYASNPSLAPRVRGRAAGRVLVRDDDPGRPLF